jgi:hypothetical protein
MKCTEPRAVTHTEVVQTQSMKCTETCAVTHAEVVQTQSMKYTEACAVTHTEVVQTESMKCTEPCTVTHIDVVQTQSMKERVQIHADVSTKTSENFANLRRAFTIMRYVNHSVTRSVSQETTCS